LNPERRPEVVEFVASARRVTGHAIEAYDVFAFGDSREMADELAALVARGDKRATASLLLEYESDGEALPRVGEYSVVLDGSGRPAAVIRTVEVTVTPFREVGEDFARDEGEGDLSLAYWREAHRAFFARSTPDFSERSPVVCERFETLYSRSPGD
jgi:uncharacterized protein YhfF